MAHSSGWGYRPVNMEFLERRPISWLADWPLLYQGGLSSVHLRCTEMTALHYSWGHCTSPSWATGSAELVMLWTHVSVESFRDGAVLAATYNLILSQIVSVTTLIFLSPFLWGPFLWTHDKPVVLDWFIFLILRISGFSDLSGFEHSYFSSRRKYRP